MRIFKSLIILILICFFLGCSEEDNSKNGVRKSPPHQPEWVSLIQLIANPEQYVGKYVFVGGYFSTDFEDEALFLCKDHYEYGILSNSIALSGSNVNKYKHLNYNYVTVYGKVSMKKRGHLGFLSPTISGDFEVKKILSRKEIEEKLNKE